MAHLNHFSLTITLLLIFFLDNSSYYLFSVCSRLLFVICVFSLRPCAVCLCIWSHGCCDVILTIRNSTELNYLASVLSLCFFIGFYVRMFVCLAYKLHSKTRD
jgi:hypothetical protein